MTSFKENDAISIGKILLKVKPELGRFTCHMAAQQCHKGFFHPATSFEDGTQLDKLSETPVPGRLFVICQVPKPPHLATITHCIVPSIYNQKHNETTQPPHLGKLRVKLQSKGEGQSMPLK